MTDTHHIIDLTLGPRPDEPGPPIGGPLTYESEIEHRLAADAAVIIARYPHPRSALLPLLHLVQAQDGYVSAAGISFCARQLDLTDAEVTAVATFYSMYRRTPTGQYLVGVCTNTLCAIMGGDAILESLENHLGIAAGQTTDDDQITLEHIECNAACDYAPVVMVNWEFFDNQTPSSATGLVDALRSGEPVVATRGGTVCPFAETARTLAGLGDPDRPADGPGTTTATLAGLRVAQALGFDSAFPASEEPGNAGVASEEPGTDSAPSEESRSSSGPSEESRTQSASAPVPDSSLGTGGVPDSSLEPDKSRRNGDGAQQ